MFYEKNPRNIAEEVNEVIERALDIIEKKRAVRLDDKVFMMGYSSSGVFEILISTIFSGLINCKTVVKSVFLFI